VSTPFGVVLRDSFLCSSFTILCYFVLAIELVLSLCVVFALRSIVARRIVCIGMILLHGGFGLTIYLGTFVPLYVAVAVLFVSSNDWNRFRVPRYIEASLNRRAWLVEGAAVMTLFWCLHQTIVSNPEIPPMFRNVVSTHTPEWLNRFSRFMMIPQEWYLYRAPASVASTVLISARRPDGSRVDPIRSIDFNPESVFLSSVYAGKYWVSYLIRLMREGNHRYRSRFAEYLFQHGYDEVEVMQGEMAIPEACGSARGEISLKPIFKMFSPQKIEFTEANVLAGKTEAKAVMNQQMWGFGREWANGSQLYADFSIERPHLVLQFNSTLECSVDIRLILTRAPDYGILDISVNDSAPTPVNSYSAIGVVREERTISGPKIRRGINQLKISLRPESPAQRTRFGIDEMWLNCRE
jgi:hypothetical protein